MLLYCHLGLGAGAAISSFAKGVGAVVSLFGLRYCCVIVVRRAFVSSFVMLLYCGLFYM